MSGPLGGVGDLYAILGAGAYLGAQIIKGIGPLTDSKCPIKGLNDLLRAVFEEVAIDEDLEREISAMIEDPKKTDDVWNLVVGIRDALEEMNEVSKWNDPNRPYESLTRVYPFDKCHYALRRRIGSRFLDIGVGVDTYFSVSDAKRLKDIFPFHTKDGELAEKTNLSLWEAVKRGPKWWFFDVEEKINKPLKENRLCAAEYIMRAWHHRYPREIVQYGLVNFNTSELIGSIGRITHHGRRELELRKTVEKNLELHDAACSAWLDASWERIEKFKDTNSLFYRLIHDHPVYSYRGDALYLVRNGNDGFDGYDEYPTCWDYVGFAKPTLANPVNKEHFIVMLMATYKMLSEQVSVSEIFDVKYDQGTVTWRYYSKNGKIQNWIRGEDWQNELKTAEEKELEHKEFLERTNWALSDRFD